MKIWLYIFGFLMILVVATFVIDRLYISKPSPAFESGSNDTSKITTTTAINQADNALNLGDRPAARTSYLAALEHEQDPQRRARLQYLLALTYVIDDPRQAIDLFKEVATNEQVHPRERAYAIQRIGMIYPQNNDAGLVPLIFSGEPFEKMYVEKDVDLAFRRLYEHALSFHSIAIAELRVAMWYANELRRTKDSAAYASTSATYIPLIREHISRAEADMKLTSTIAGPKDLIPDALYLKAVLLARLYLAGADNNLAVVETAFQAALDAAIAQKFPPGIDGSARFGYATFLAKYTDESRLSDVKTLLEPMITGHDKYPVFELFFRTEKNNVRNQKADLVLLSNLLPEFKEMLIELGWTEADFTS
jgi:hypothetical protein